MPYLWGFTDAVHGAIQQQRHMDIVANNLANVNTAGFKADRLIFNDIMTRQIMVDHRQGSLKVTHNPLDVAIEGQGFFQVKTKDGIRLTRNGNFSMLGDGRLVTMQGYPVLSAGGSPITLNPSGPRVHIDEKGGIYQGDNKLAVLGIVDVDDKTTLEKVGNNLFAGTGGKNPKVRPARDYSVSQGTLEMSNVEVVRQMVGMISAHRSFESYMKAIHAMEEIDTKAATQVGRVA